MKKFPKFLFFIALLLTVSIGNAQDEPIKNDSILQQKMEKKELKAKNAKISKEDKAAKKKVKDGKKAAKKLKKKEKLAKSISKKEKTIRKNESKVVKLQNKIETSKGKGKLAPADEIKMNEKIEKLKAALVKDKERLAKLQKKQ